MRVISPQNSDVKATSFGKVRFFATSLSDAVKTGAKGIVKIITPRTTDEFCHVNNPILSLKRVIPVKPATQEWAEKIFGKYVTQDKVDYILEKHPHIAEVFKAAGRTPVIVTDAFPMLNGHNEGVNNLAEGIMRDSYPKMFSEADIEIAKSAGQLHDMAKTVMWDEIMFNGRFNEAQRNLVNTHAKLGELLLKGVPGLHPRIPKIVGLHHSDISEIKKLGDDKLIATVEILKASDVFDALTAFDRTRPYRKPFSKDKAIEIMWEDVENGKLSRNSVNALLRHLSLRSNTESKPHFVPYLQPGLIG